MTKLNMKSTMSFRDQHLPELKTTPFIPDKKLREIVTAETVCAELKKSNYSNLRRIHARPVTVEDGGEYQKILAILYLIKLPSKIRKFVKYGVCDKDLPLVACENSKDASSPKLRSGHDCTAHPIRFKRKEYIQDFLDTQWEVLAPIFPWTGGDHIWHRRLMPETIIPFISHDRTAQGGYSKVLKTKIYPTHHQFGNGNIFAVKVLKECDQEAFKQEAVILGRFSNPLHSHKHLITLLATFEHKEMFHFIFPWAEADLLTFWKKRRDPPNSEKMETWIIEQCYGLAEALNTINRYETMSGTTLIDHVSKQVEGNGEQRTIQIEISSTDHPLRNLFGRHGDLKPENILWFPCPESPGGHGILKITDFGAARFNTVNIWDTRKTGRIPNSAVYSSPEIDLDGRLTTACDVWALGCVYLQFISWFCGGNSRLEDFGRRRLADDYKLANVPNGTFFSLVQEGELMKAIVKPAVVDEDMLVVYQQEASGCQESITPGIERVSESIPPNGSDTVVNRRKSCGNIWRRIGDIKATGD
ncbi:uncharacterized protein yc1106_00177 [Curvularia clavata]|uniref:Protein kinase domain-containing protein n=1 Tax=Curvularia clavata TaxID=95742 RepID=A0A9Q8Z2S8_CURCL|nr:uncharacterized protein yc1106_00177 [Curvularia clavata]